VDGGTKIAGAGITIQSLLNAAAAGTNTGTTYAAYAEAGATAGSGLASFSGAFTDAVDASVVDTFVLSGATLTATGAITVLSAAYGAVRAFSHGISVAGGLASASPTPRRSRAPRWSPASRATSAPRRRPAAASLDVKTLATQTADAESDAVSGGILAAGNAALANAEVRETGSAPNARAGLGSGTITSPEPQRPRSAARLGGRGHRRPVRRRRRVGRRLPGGRDALADRPRRHRRRCRAQRLRRG
jgi:hypothetical protein